VSNGDLPAASSTASGPRIALAAGEASGDLLGADLIRSLRERYPQAEFAGIGGDAMREAGCDTWNDVSELSVMGLIEVLKHLPQLLQLRRQFRKRAREWQPDVFIGIDAPDFNLGIEHWLKQRGIRTVHYVSPSIWAWREKRVNKIGAAVDRVLCLFPMEAPLYARHGIDAVFVGHPMADAIPLESGRAAARARLGLPADVPVLAVLPGSRRGELERLCEPFIEAARRASKALPRLQIVVPAANDACHQFLRQHLVDSAMSGENLRLLRGQSCAAMTAADVVLLASGTATLETMLVKRPMVVGYRISPMTHAIVKSLGLLKVDRYALPNILAGEDLVPEFLQQECTPAHLTEAMLYWFRHPEAVAALQPKFLELHMQLRRHASARAAEAVAELLSQPPLPHPQ
jgi:lipid-A-disaccharide synthase